MFTPFEVFDHLRETLAAYLETAYKLSNRPAYAERGALLREGGLVPTIAQAPYIESTPAFPAGLTFDALAPTLAGVPVQLPDLAAFGMPVRDYPLYEHQERALQHAFGSTPNLVVATGTASGKTEIFLLILLADILRDALSWPAPVRAGERGTYNSSQQRWLHSRLHERRPASVRAIILYPMNALVHDQLQRIRKVLASPASEAWQRRTLRGNVIYFGMYTGDAQPTGHWSNRYRRRDWDEYHFEIASVFAPAHVEGILRAMNVNRFHLERRGPVSVINTRP